MLAERIREHVHLTHSRFSKQSSCTLYCLNHLHPQARVILELAHCATVIFHHAISELTSIISCITLYI